MSMTGLEQLSMGGAKKKKKAQTGWDYAGSTGFLDTPEAQAKIAADKASGAWDAPMYLMSSSPIKEMTSTQDSKKKKAFDWQSHLDEGLAAGDLSQEDFDAISGFKNTDKEDRFSGTGVGRAIRNGNWDVAAGRANTATSLYGSTADNATLRDSISSIYGDPEGTKKKDTAQKSYDAYQSAHPASTDEDTAPEIPTGIGDATVQPTIDTSGDMLGRANDFLNAGQNYADQSFDPSVSDSFMNDAQGAMDTQMSYIDQLYNTDRNNAGVEGEKFLQAGAQGREGLYNAGLEDSSTARGVSRDLSRDYTNAKLGQQNAAFDKMRGEVLGERTGLRNLATGYSGQANSQGNNYANMGMQGLTNANSMNLANMGFYRDTLEQNYTNEQNARLAQWNMLQNKWMMDHYGKKILDNYANPEPQGGGIPWGQIASTAGTAAMMAA